MSLEPGNGMGDWGRIYDRLAEQDRAAQERLARDLAREGRNLTGGQRLSMLRCSRCDGRLGCNNHSGVCSACQNKSGKVANTRRRRAKKRAARTR